MSKYHPVKDYGELLAKVHALSDQLAEQAEQNRQEHIALQADYEQKLEAAVAVFNTELSSLKALFLGLQNKITSEHRRDFDRIDRARGLIVSVKEDG